MYQSKIPLSSKTKQQNKNDIFQHIHRHPLQKCKALRRNARLSKFIESNEKKQDAYIRFQCFFAALDILKKEHLSIKKWKRGKLCYEILGISKDGEIVKIHLREEVEEKDRVLYLISCFYKKK